MPIPIETFLSPQDLNILDCVTAARYLKQVPDALEIVSVCQDQNNIGLVIIDFTLVGTFTYNPECRILSVDGDTSYTENNIIAPLVIHSSLNSEIPLNTNCQVLNGTLVFDFGRVIHNFTTVQSIVFELRMAGTIPQSFGVSIPSQNPTDQYTWNKGVLPKPIGILYTEEGFINVSFGYEGGVDCSCNVLCLSPSGVTHELTFCPGDTQNVLFSSDPDSQDVYNILLKLVDSIGNESLIDVDTYVFMKPRSVQAVLGSKPKRIDIILSRESINGTQLRSDAQYQIIKFHGSPQNTTIWKDWSSVNWNYFVDYDIVPGEIYGYAVRFKGQFNDVSLQSNWTVIQA